jgi:hypothetical protein
MLQLVKVAFSFAVLVAPALAQSTVRPGTPPPSTTDQAQKDQAPETRANGNRASRDRQSWPQESDRSTIGPQTTQSLMQDAIARSNSR